LKILGNVQIVDFVKARIKKCTILLSGGKIEEFFNPKEHLPGGIQKLNLEASYLIPGFIDCHTHLLSRGVEMQRIDLNECRSLNDCLEKLRVNFKKADNLLFGCNWDESKWLTGSKEELIKESLDRISMKIPIIMRRVCGHFAVCNTKALSLIHSHWRIVDRKRGHLYEDVALNLSEIFPPTDEVLKKAIEIAGNEAVSLGITTIHEIVNVRGFRIYQKMKDKLKLRVAVYLPLKNFEGIISSGMASNLGDDFLKFSGIKIFLDGSIGARTAALSKPYRKSKVCGTLLVSKPQLINIIKKAEKSSIQLMMHAIGDRATMTVLNAMDDIGIKENRLRHRIEHLEILDDKLIRKIKKLNIIASMQPNFVRQWQNPGGMYENHLGEGYKEMNPFRKLLSSGVRVVFGSDCMPLGPLFGIEGAVKHPFSSGRLTPHEAFSLYTTRGAYATFDEDKKGKIEVGKLADFVVLDKNPLKKENLTNLKILGVLVNGKLAFEHDDLATCLNWE